MDVREFIAALARLPGTVASDTRIVCVEEDEDRMHVEYEITACTKDGGTIYLWMA